MPCWPRPAKRPPNGRSARPSGRRGKAGQAKADRTTSAPVKAARMKDGLLALISRGACHLEDGHVSLP